MLLSQNPQAPPKLVALFFGYFHPRLVLSLVLVFLCSLGFASNPARRFASGCFGGRLLFGLSEPCVGLAPFFYGLDACATPFMAAAET